MPPRAACAVGIAAALGCFAVAPLVWSAAAGEPAPAAEQQPARAAAKLDFNRDVRPILSEKCFFCHGPDERARKGDLRLDVAAEATKDRGGYAAIVPGRAADSALVSRIASADEDERMPPPASGRTLADREIAVLKQWIDEGAEYLPHWSLMAPRRAEPQPVKREAWARNPIDRFVLARLEREGLPPSAEADRETLLRRVTLDLTGLPPSIAEIDAFVLDNRPDAYERVVDRLLASPRYGERMAVPWLDAARYADTHGYQDDGVRHMWRWRDWVIDAFNRNVPFDQFTIEQLAGDLLPDATLDQKIATGFNRNHRGNSEGGIIPEEYLVEYVVDRVDTTATVWLGLTVGCARCHDHKFDPFTSREFYQLYAFFNNIPEQGRALKQGNSPPTIKAPTADEQRLMAETERALAAAEAELVNLEPRLAAAQAAWEQSLDRGTDIDWSYTDGLVVHFTLDGTPASAIAVKDEDKKGEGKKAESKFADGEAAYTDGVAGQAAQFDGRRYIEAGNVADYGERDKFSYGAWVFAKPGQGGPVLSRMDDEKMYEGYDLLLTDGRVQVYMGNRFLDDSIRVETADPIAPDRWHHLMVAYDGSQAAAGVRIYVDGEPAPVEIRNDTSNNPFRTKEPMRIGSRGVGDRFTGSIDDVRFYDHDLTPDEVAAVASVDAINRIAAIPVAERSTAQLAKLRTYYLKHHAPDAAREAIDRVKNLRHKRRQLDEAAPTVMVMRELEPPKETFVLVRGEYDKPGERVERGVPASLPPLAADAPRDRLGFARWLVDPANPLSARVAVNRYWQLYFGTGLVKTTEDFGSQGQPPSHPELLDWLATEFIRIGWDTKAMQKLIVTSATYRQSSSVDAHLAAADPENRLLARGPRFRLPAGTIRDAALAASGLLVEKIGGPSVKPYQPPGLWEELTAISYKQDEGEGLYRRSMYTFWKRTIAPPNMMQFDSSSRETCVVRSGRTNTPLQALTLLNDVTYVEAARGLAQRMLVEGGATPRERITLAFRLVTGRRPQGDELAVLTRGLEKHLARYAAEPDAAKRLIAFGESKPNETLNPAEVAAYTTVAGVILNLDEAITKE
ncbi:MAG: DUF1553 domain-containing protein [Planctomycetia bacterium]|nr:DUF1553 domain-containing protein [Planctomycetia bacterium]